MEKPLQDDKGQSATCMPPCSPQAGFPTPTPTLCQRLCTPNGPSATSFPTDPAKWNQRKIFTLSPSSFQNHSSHPLHTSRCIERDSCYHRMTVTQTQGTGRQMPTAGQTLRGGPLGIANFLGCPSPQLVKSGWCQGHRQGKRPL